MVRPLFHAVFHVVVMQLQMTSSSDVHRLRVQFRVVGGLVGALPVKPRQNSQLGLPVLLMPEEVSLLREEGEWLLWSVAL